MAGSGRLGALLLAAGSFVSACGGGPERDYAQRTTLNSPVHCGVGNFTVVLIDPAGRSVDLRWDGFNQRRGSAQRIPYEEITVFAGDESYFITDRGVGNGALMVNGRLHTLKGAAPTLVIRFGEGVSYAPAFPYEKARHCHDPF